MMKYKLHEAEVLRKQRRAILRLLFGASGLGLRAFATGIPLPLLLDPRRAQARSDAMVQATAAGNAQYLILSSSQAGDPLNCNVPGTYSDPKVAHPVNPAMAATNFTVGGQQVTAAAPWATLGADVLARTNFFHHRTDSVGHGDLLKSLRLSGGISRGEVLPSLLASELQAPLGTIQPQPITLGAVDAGEALQYEGRGIPMLVPNALKDVLTMSDGPLKNVRSLRDDTLNKLVAWYKKNGTDGQNSFLDRWTNTQTTLRQVSENLLSTLAGITDNGPTGQIAGAVALLQLNASPCISLHFDFGSDNHGDAGLAYEATSHITSIGSIGSLMSKLSAAGLADKTTFMTLNVFGRTLASRGTSGRDHNEAHHCTVLIGKNVKGGVTGGIAPLGGDYGATGIVSSSGQSSASGDISATESFSALAKTVGRAVGVSQAFLDDRIAVGKTVSAALTLA